MKLRITPIPEMLLDKKLLCVCDRPIERAGAFLTLVDDVSGELVGVVALCTKCLAVEPSQTASDMIVRAGAMSQAAVKLVQQSDLIAKMAAEVSKLGLWPDLEGARVNAILDAIERGDIKMATTAQLLAI